MFAECTIYLVDRNLLDQQDRGYCVYSTDEVTRTVPYCFYSRVLFIQSPEAQDTDPEREFDRKSNTSIITNIAY